MSSKHFMLKLKKIEKYHTGTGMSRPYLGPWRVGSEFINFISRESGSGSKFHYKDVIVVWVVDICFKEPFQCKVADKIRNSENCQDETTFNSQDVDGHLVSKM
ncbi:hypothetical protein M9H77_34364 [Catharanthus roseus]|uniref:Uncharacterized protein n=1 Tax=Catharanthus roseus TaxID=4058 RepID=A0ACB9ZMP0_CATRO|nr:hypothetical protein M9H77_34364 [Catharanthus roseus]